MKYLRYSDLVERGLVRNRMTLWRWVKSGHFPAPVELGPNTRAWPEPSVEEFERRISAKTSQAA
jgi:predicted DNA-binding transcriptional regulator AlpA